MELWQAFILGIIQGLTEFLPVSSSGHLALVEYFLGFEHLKDFIFFHLVCHLGTLLAIFCYFYPLLKNRSLNLYSKIWQVFLGTLPLFPLVFVIKPIKELFDNPLLLGPCFLFTASLLFASFFYHFPVTNRFSKQWPQILTIGFFQSLAILPGISRSGATISTAKLLGWSKERAVLFSFLLAIPAILGGVIVESWQACHSPLNTYNTINASPLIIGFVTSFLMGCFSLRLLMRCVNKDKWNYFGWYCLCLGVCTTIYFTIDYYVKSN